MTQDNYEFSTQQNQTIRELATKMGQVGVFLLITGILSMVWFVVTALNDIKYGVVALGFAIYFAITGVLTLRSQRDFRRIVESEGNDILYTMHALTELRRFYILKFWLVMACIILIMLGIPTAT